MRAPDEMRVAGFAIEDEESEAGMRCVAAPVRDIPGKVTLPWAWPGRHGA